MRRYLVVSLILLVLVLFPVAVGQPYILDIVTKIFIMCILCVTLRLVLLTGLFSLGHTAFWAAGAYASAKLTLDLGISFWLALPLSGIISALLGLAISYPTFRVKGIYFAIITIAFAHLVEEVLAHLDFFGGLKGISGIPAPSIGGIQLVGPTPWYYVALFLLLITVAVLYRLENSRLMRIFFSIRESEQLAKSIGINTMYYMLLSWLIACFFTGMAGSVYAHTMTYINPHYFRNWISLILFLCIIVGGRARLEGAIIGALLYTVLPYLLHAFEKWQQFAFAAITLVVIALFPNGLISLPQQLKLYYQRFRERLTAQKQAAS